MIVSIRTFTLISLVAIIAGLVAVGGLVATALTSVAGFGFPFTRLLPSHYIGILSLILLVPVILARYRSHLEGGMGFAAFRRFRPAAVPPVRGGAVPVGVRGR